VDLANLHREEIFTDLKVATLRRLSPVKADGARPFQAVLFLGRRT
jgi:hypothetical protein